MALPTTNLKLKDVATALGMSLTNISMYAVFNNLSVNGNGLNPTYCAGADSAARLANLRTTPYSLNKFRGYEHLTLTQMQVSYSSLQNPCGAPSNVVTVYCTHANLAIAYANGGYIYSDAQGTTHASIGNYSDAANTWYSYSSGFTAVINCSSLSAISALGPYQDSATACAAFGDEVTYYFDGMFNFPFTGDTVYTDSSGTTPASDGAYSANGNYWIVGRGGLVEDHGKC